MRDGGCGRITYKAPSGRKKSLKTLPNLVILLKLGWMPTIHTLHSVKIDVYSREHLPPHFHALYAEDEILVEIKTLDTYAGYLPARQHNMVLKWAGGPGIQAFLRDIFKRLNPHLRS